MLLARNNQPAAALEASAAAHNAGVESPYLLWVRGLALAGNGDLPAARRDFQKLSETPGYYAHVGGLQAARLSLYDGHIARAVNELTRVVDVTRREGDSTLELRRAHPAGAGGARHRRSRGARAPNPPSVLRLTAPDTTRPNGIRDAGALALMVADVPSARACLARLDPSTPNTIVQAAHLFLAGDIARSRAAVP